MGIETSGASSYYITRELKPKPIETEKRHLVPKEQIRKERSGQRGLLDLLEG